MSGDGLGRRQLFPLVLLDGWRGRGAAAREQLIPRKCVMKCGAACFHEAPNERHGRDAFADIVVRRLSRRTLLKGAAAATVPLVLSATPADGALLGASPLQPRRAEAAVPGKSLGFTPLPLKTSEGLQIPPGYSSKVLLRWGDPIFPGMERMTVDNASAALQERTFGYNCDFNAFFPIEGRTGVLCVNHEYTDRRAPPRPRPAPSPIPHGHRRRIWPVERKAAPA